MLIGLSIVTAGDVLVVWVLISPLRFVLTDLNHYHYCKLKY